MRDAAFFVIIFAAVQAAASTNVSFDVGADLRVRQEAMKNIPQAGLSGNGGGAPYQNWIRTRTRVWGRVDAGPFAVYSRIGEEFRWYPTGAAPKGNRKNWSFPDEFYLDSLYFDAAGLLDGFLDLRVGRQDFAGRDAYGSMRILGDGNGSDDSRSIFFDAVRLRMHFTQTEYLDALALWCNGHDSLNWGRNYSESDRYSVQDRQRNTIVQGSRGLVESGGGLYHRSRSIEELPMDFYWIFKRESHAWAKDGSKLAGRSFHTFGALARPRWNRYLSSELEFAYQVGEKDSGAAVGGHMAYCDLKWEMMPGEDISPWVKAACYYMSGDRNRSGDGEADRAWDPVWARWPQFSDLYAKVFEYGIGYWSNVLYASAEAGCDIGRDFSVKGATGPLLAPVGDELGGGNGNYLGWLTTAQVGCTLFRGLFADGRGSVAMHVRGELLNGGGYFRESHDSYYLRWDVSVSF